MNRIYLDHTATTPLDPRVREAMGPYFSEQFGNASSVHSYGRQAKAGLEKARGTIAQSIGAEPGELFFTSGGTESDNLAIVGAARAARATGRTHLVTSRGEHHAVLDTCAALANEGHSLSLADLDEYGRVDTELVRSLVKEKTSVVSIMHANNEIGTINPVAAIASAAHQSGALVHTDAVQSVGKIPVIVKDLGVDLMTFTAHKLYGPKGIGALYVRRGTMLDPLFHGGGQERGKRPGTENVALAVGFAVAVDLALRAMSEESARLAALRDALESTIRARFPYIIFNGDPSNRLPHILSISVDSRRMRLEGEMLVPNMDLRGIAVASGSACTSGSIQPSHVILAMGRDSDTARATIRFSFGMSNKEDDVGYVTDSLGGVLAQMAKG
ncbi:MAG: iscS [Bacteroidetes bacterium]|nr:iscS [Bacteroidota bacterium]